VEAGLAEETAVWRMAAAPRTDQARQNRRPVFGATRLGRQSYLGRGRRAMAAEMAGEPVTAAVRRLAVRAAGVEAESSRRAVN